MKSTISTPIFITIASLGQCVAQGLGVQWVDPGPQLPGVWLYNGTDGAEPYTFRMSLNDTCHAGLANYAGIWIGKDSRSVGYRLGCGYAYQYDDCSGTFEPFELNFSGEAHTIMPFDNITPEDKGESFRFTNSPCTGGGSVYHEVSSLIEPTQ